ncbi:MAG: hypothetical protein ACXABV_00575 [Candidatus Thorarchaeota archaeon]
MVDRTKAGLVLFGVGFVIMSMIVTVDFYYSLMDFETYLSYINATWQITNPVGILACLMIIVGVLALSRGGKKES